MLNILICCLAVSLQQNDSTVTIEVKDNLGWHYIVPSNKIVDKHGSIFVSDNSGVIYLDTSRFQVIRKVTILRNGIDITNDVKFFARTEHNVYKNGKYERYQLVKFFIPTEKRPTCCPGSDWDDPEVYYEYSKEEQKKREKMILEGKMKFN